MKASLIRPLFLLGIAGHGAMLLAQSTGTFTGTGNMTTARFGHSATLLADGRVLIVGAIPMRTLSKSPVVAPLVRSFTTPRPVRSYRQAA
jgi:hypothetical protein